jgi:hypothetical protein
MMLQRQLVQTSKKRVVSHDMVDGLCYVQQLEDPADIEEWVSNYDHFFVAKQTNNRGAALHRPNSFTSCESCLSHRIRKLQEEEDFRKTHSRLRSMELFSGARKFFLDRVESSDIFNRCGWSQHRLRSE